MSDLDAVSDDPPLGVSADCCSSSAANANDASVNAEGDFGDSSICRMQEIVIVALMQERGSQAIKPCSRQPW